MSKLFGSMGVYCVIASYLFSSTVAVMGASANSVASKTTPEQNFLVSVYMLKGESNTKNLAQTQAFQDALKEYGKESAGTTTKTKVDNLADAMVKLNISSPAQVQKVIDSANAIDLSSVHSDDEFATTLATIVGTEAQGAQFSACGAMAGRIAAVVGVTGVIAGIVGAVLETCPAGFTDDTYEDGNCVHWSNSPTPPYQNTSTDADKYHPTSSKILMGVGFGSAFAALVYAILSDVSCS